MVDMSAQIIVVNSGCLSWGLMPVRFHSLEDRVATCYSHTPRVCSFEGSSFDVSQSDVIKIGSDEQLDWSQSALEDLISEENKQQEVDFRNAVKDFSEEEVIDYANAGHLPPPERAFKVRKKENPKLTSSLVVLASGKVFATGKNNDIDPKHSIPGGRQAEALDEGSTKLGFSVVERKSGERMVILISKFPNPWRLSEMREEARITQNIPSSHIARSYFYLRESKSGVFKGYLESELCEGGSLNDHYELAENEIVKSQIEQAVDEIHQAGYAHRDLHSRNILFVKKPTESLEIKIIDFGWAKPLCIDTQKEMLEKDMACLNQLGEINSSSLSR